MTIERLKIWREIEAASQQLSELAHQKQWEQLSELEPKRLQMLKRFFSEPVVKEISSEVASGIELILETDREIDRLVQQSRLKITTQLQKISKGKRVIGAYASNT